MQVQIFGTNNDSETRKALRFFAERRIDVHFVDLKRRAASKGELRRFVQRFGVDGVLDRGSKQFANLGLGHAKLSDDRWLEKMADEPLLVRTPLVRWRQLLTVGAAEEEWRGWLDQA